MHYEYLNRDIFANDDMGFKITEEEQWIGYTK